MASTPENRLDRIAQSSDILRAKSEALVAQSGERMESAKRLLTSARRTAEGVPVASDGAPLHEGLRGSGPDELAALVRLQGIGARFVRDGDITGALEDTLAAVMMLTATDLGNVQLCNRDTGALEIVAQQGFGEEFRELFAAAHTEAPFLTPSGVIVGTIWIHSLLPAGAVDPRTLRLVDLFARQAADLIVHSRVCRAHPR